MRCAPQYTDISNQGIEAVNVCMGQGKSALQRVTPTEGCSPVESVLKIEHLVTCCSNNDLRV